METTITGHSMQFGSVRKCRTGVGNCGAMEMNIEQLKMKIATAIERRLSAPNGGRAKYHLWINPETREIGCGWATILRLQPYQKIVHTFMRDPNDGFSSDEWNTIAEKFAPYFL